jgi:methylenetetrahydrofolate--tRNA-(uracil-5-)-methyltransferase
MQRRVTIVGAGLAGCEAAWQAARRGLDVTHLEMKPAHFSPAHREPAFAELVCSNSLRAAGLGNAVGLLKEEMRRLCSLVMAVADETAVPAGRALAVDRIAFSRRITETLESHPRIEVRHELVSRIPRDGRTILASGPLTAPELADDLRRTIGEEYLYFYDAISPIVYADSIDMDVAFRASRWEEGEGDYLNLALDAAAYDRFVDALLAAETVPLHAFEAALYFEGCLPIEEMARRGRDTLAYGPMKPVGLRDPRGAERPRAVVQLRQEDKRGVLYNLVGFQTKMRVGEQQRVFRGLPGLADAVFARYGSVHRNTYLNAPTKLDPHLALRALPGVHVAGQLAGVEGYVESAALGLLAGVFASFLEHGLEPPRPAATTAHGALLRHLGDADPGRFQPMNVNYGLFPPLAAPGAPARRLRKPEKNAALAARALDDLAGFASAAEALVA